MIRIPARIGRLAATVPLGLLLLGGPIASSTAGERADRFLTNLALLDRLTREAVEQILDSLDVEPGERLMVLADGYNEGNGFVADAFARELASRGCTVQLLEEAGSAAAAEPATPTAPAAEPGEEETAEDEEGFDQDLFAADSSEVVSDSLAWGETSDSTAVEEEVVAQDVTESEPEAEEEAPASAPVPPTSVPVVRTYPEGEILEFQVLEFGVSYPSVKRRLGLFGRPSVHRIGGVYIQASRIEGPDGAIVAVASGQSHWQDRLSAAERVLAEGASFPFVEPTVPSGKLGRMVEPLLVVGIISSLVYLFYQNQN